MTDERPMPWWAVDLWKWTEFPSRRKTCLAVRAELNRLRTEVAVLQKVRDAAVELRHSLCGLTDQNHDQMALCLFDQALAKEHDDGV